MNKKLKSSNKNYYSIANKPNKKDLDLLYYINRNNKKLEFYNILNSKNLNWEQKIKNPLFFKRILCNNHFLLNNCYDGNKCNKAHKINELTGNFLFHIKDFKHLYYFYKTEFCPFIKFNHSYHNCIYSHGFLDYRRPYVNILIPKICNNFKKFMLKYNKNKTIEILKNDICKNYDKCFYLHSYHEYHLHKENILKKNFNKNILGEKLKKHFKIFKENSNFF